MVFNDLEYDAVNKEVKQFVDNIRPPEYFRSELDIVYQVGDQTIDIGQLRRVSRGSSGKKHVIPFARIKYVRSLNRWSIYWMHRDLKWLVYSIEASLSDALEIVRVDPDSCFWRK